MLQLAGPASALPSSAGARVLLTGTTYGVSASTVGRYLNTVATVPEPYRNEDIPLKTEPFDPPTSVYTQLLLTGSIYGVLYEVGTYGITPGIHPSGWRADITATATLEANSAARVVFRAHAPDSALDLQATGTTAQASAGARLVFRGTASATVDIGAAGDATEVEQQPQAAGGWYPQQWPVRPRVRRPSVEALQPKPAPRPRPAVGEALVRIAAPLVIAGGRYKPRAVRGVAATVNGQVSLDLQSRGRYDDSILADDELVALLLASE